jgi:hypothetical protein
MERHDMNSIHVETAVSVAITARTAYKSYVNSNVNLLPFFYAVFPKENFS